jgi:transcriptional regulator with XRE-family HTH domain
MKMFAKRLKRLREDTGLQQQEMATKLGITRTTYHYYETGKREPDHETLVFLANEFGVTTDYLLGKTDYPQTVLKFDIPKELQQIGISYLIVAKHMQDKAIPPDDIERIIEIVSANDKVKKGLG